MARFKLVLVVSLASITVAGIPPIDRIMPIQVARGTTLNPIRVSVAEDGNQADNRSYLAAVSDDGTQIAFGSLASNLVAGDTNGQADFFVRDLKERTTTRVSLTSDGTQGSSETESETAPKISADGRFVAFQSAKSNLVSGDTNATEDIFVHDRDADEDGIYDETGAGERKTVRVSVSSSGIEANGSSHLPALSLTGRYVTFYSFATNISSGDTNAKADVFVHDRDTDGDGTFDELGAIATTRVSDTTGGAQGNNTSQRPAISADGRYVSFETFATNLVTPDTNGASDIVRKDGATSAYSRVSQNFSTQASATSSDASSSADGRVVGFKSAATNLVVPDGAFDDIFAWAGGTVELVSQSTAGVRQTSGGGGGSSSPSLSRTGRFVVFSSLSRDLEIGDTNARGDVFLRDRLAGTTVRVSLGQSGVQGNGTSSSSAISRPGRHVAYSSAATNLVPSDTNVQADIFLYDRGISVPLERTFGFNSGGHAIDTWSFWSDPVNSATGAFTHSEIDVRLPGLGLPFTFERSYTSADSTVGVLGPGWTHNLAAALIVNANGDVTFRSESGAQIAYAKDELDGTFEPLAAGTLSTLKAVSGGYELRRKDQVVYAFDSQGRLTGVADRSGNSLTPAYDANGRLLTVTDTTGALIEFTHDTSGLLTNVSLPDGRGVSFAYTAGKLTEVTDLRGEAISYTYDTGGRLEKVIDQRGKTIVRNVYGSGGRVEEQYDAVGNQSTFGWDVSAETATLTDARGEIWRDVYKGNIVQSRIDATGERLDLSYNDELGPTTVTDPATNAWILTYDERGNLLSRTAPAPLSFTEAWTYDADNNPTSYTNALGNTWSYDYDASGRMIEEARPDDTSQTFTYNDDALVETISDFRGNTTTFGYDGAGNLTSIETPLGYTTSYTFDAGGRMVTRVDPRGNETGATPSDYTTTYTYDDAGNVLTETDPLGNVTTYTYDPAGHLATKTDDLSRVTTYTYNDAGELASEEAPGGRVTSYEYDERGAIIQVIAPLGRATAYTYDPAGRLASLVTPRGNLTGADPDDYRWSYEYDPRGQRTKQTDPLGGITEYAYDVAGRLIAILDARGKTTSFGHDAAGNKTSVTDPLDHETEFTYDSLGRIETITDPRGKTTDHDYDANGNLIAVTTPLGNKRTYVFDEDNRLQSTVDSRGNVMGATPDDFRWTYGYDAAGNRVSQTDPLGNLTQWEINRVGLLSKRIDALTRATTYSYDDIGRPISVDPPLVAATTYSYNPAGDLTDRTDALGHTTGYDYDGAGRLTQKTTPLGQVWTYAYDAADNMTSVVDAADNATPGISGDGTTTYTFDSLERRTGIGYSDATPDVGLGYDELGNRISMLDGGGTETSTYDDAGRLTTITRGASTIAYEYDEADNLTKRTYPDGTEVVLAYDDDERLSDVTQGTSVTAYAYDQAGNLTATDNANGTDETRIYDRAGWLSEIRHAKGATTLALAGYTRDAIGNPTAVLTTDGTGTYDYDDLDRLTEACFTATCSGIAPDGGDSFLRYAYDDVGNRTSQTRPLGTTTYTYNAGDQLTQEQGPAGTITYAYDPNGNQTRAGLRTFSYDLADRLIRTQRLSTVFTYSYDGDGKRQSATQANVLPPSVTTYTWDPNAPLPELIAERDAAGGLIRRYVHGQDLISTTSPDPLDPTQTKTLTLHPDGVGSTVAATDGAGDVDWRYTYDPYGEQRRQAKDDPLAPENRIRFTGELLDIETGMYHLRARQYQPVTGRFLTTDPVPQRVGSARKSAYLYADDRPTVLADPSGLRPELGTCCPVTPGDLWTSFLGVPNWWWRSLQETGARRVDEYIAATGHVPSGLDLANLAVNPAYRALDKCSGGVTNRNVIECALAAIDTATTALAIEQAANALGKALSTEILAAETGEGLTVAGEQATIHGAERLTQAGFTEELIAETRAGFATTQADGASVFVREVSPGRFDFFVEGENGVVTAHRGWSLKSVSRLAANYGWEGWPP